jgi:hypothetical protein
MRSSVAAYKEKLKKKAHELMMVNLNRNKDGWGKKAQKVVRVTKETVPKKESSPINTVRATFDTEGN